MITSDQDGTILETLRMVRFSPVKAFSGYEADIDGATIPGWIVIADVEGEGNKPILTCLRWSEARKWFHRAQQFLKENANDPDFTCNLVDAMYETEHKEA